MTIPRVLSPSEMQRTSNKIWTRVADSISNDNDICASYARLLKVSIAHNMKKYTMTVHKVMFYSL